MEVWFPLGITKLPSPSSPGQPRQPDLAQTRGQVHAVAYSSATSGGQQFLYP